MRGVSGLERMYGVARFLADYYDLYAKAGIPITPAVQQAARAAVCDWLNAHPLRELHVVFQAPADAANETDDETDDPHAAHH